MPDQMRSIALLGAGKMGFALLEGWLRGALKDSTFYILEPTPHPALLKTAGPSVIINPPTAEIGKVDVMVVAVKPQLLADVLPTVKSFIQKTTLVISVAAGKTTAEFEKTLGPQQPIIRAMPNTPATIGVGISALFANRQTSDHGRSVGEEVMSSVGEVVWLESEKDMDAVTALSGSGPAYVFLLTECMTHAGINQGLSPDLARQLAEATVSGAGALISASQEDPSKLRKNVTSPGGTTAAALDVLMGDDSLESLIDKAIDAASKRSKELGK